MQKNDHVVHRMDATEKLEEIFDVTKPLTKEETAEIILIYLRAVVDGMNRRELETFQSQLKGSAQPVHPRIIKMIEERLGAREHFRNRIYRCLSREVRGN